MQSLTATDYELLHKMREGIEGRQIDAGATREAVLIERISALEKQNAAAWAYANTALADADYQRIRAERWRSRWAAAFGAVLLGVAWDVVRLIVRSV
jgi:hypothetical protein